MMKININNCRILLILVLGFCSTNINADSITVVANKKYLNIPISMKAARQNMTIEVNGVKTHSFEVRLATDNPDYWVFNDISEFNGKNITLTFPENKKGLQRIYQSDKFNGEDEVYKEEKRPQFHFTTKRGWINDPNGLIFYEGEYHLFYQHNPYEREWENMHWGHAVSKDLIHWEELPSALYPDELGTMFSGSAVIDYNNTAGFNKKDQPAMVAFYTADSPEKQVQCLAYSLDKGRSFTKYNGNPIIDSKDKWNSKDTRDPKVFWYESNQNWVMILNERDGHSIYNSDNLKDWVFKSHITGFWECPELFELSVDNNENKKLWVMYGASGTYMIGKFNGKEFVPISGKHYYNKGSGYAAQTFTNIPKSDDRRIQISWGRISAGDSPFNGIMLLPTELTLHTTKDGVRMFSKPIKELDKLENESYKWENLTSQEANKKLKDFNDESCLRIKTTITLSHATSAGLNLNGQSLLDYDMNWNTVNGVFYSPEDMTSMEISADIIIDKTSVEVFIDGGAYSLSMEKNGRDLNEGFNFWGNNILIKNLTICTMQSIWNKQIK